MSKPKIDKAALTKIIEEIKSLCKSVGMEKDYIFKVNTVYTGNLNSTSLTETNSIEFTFKDYPDKTSKAFTSLETQINKTKYKDIVLIDPGYIPNINDNFELFEAKRYKMNIEALIVKKKSKFLIN